MSHVISTFSGREEAERRGDERVDLIEAARPCGPQERFQFGKRLLDRIEVGTVRGKKPELRADPFDRGADLWLLVDGEVIEDHNVARAQRGHEDLFDIGEETRTVDRAVEDGWRAEALEPQRRDHRMGLPVAAGRVIAEPRAPWTAAIAPQEIRRHATFIQEHVLAHIADRQPVVPLATLRDNVRPSLLVGVYGFF